MEIIRIRRQNDDRGHSFGMEERDNHSLDNDCVEPVADLKLIRKKNESMIKKITVLYDHV